MIIAREGTPGVFAELPVGTSIIKEGMQYPWQIVELWSDADLKALNIYRVAIVEPPVGKKLVSYSIARVSNVVRYVPIFENIPVPEPITLTAYAESARWLKEVGGINFNGVPVSTDDRSKQMILGARVAANGNPDFETPWVGADGSVYPLNADAVIAVSNAVLAHVAACFSIYATVKSAIDGGTITTEAQIDAAFA